MTPTSTTTDTFTACPKCGGALTPVSGLIGGRPALSCTRGNRRYMVLRKPVIKAATKATP